MASKRETWLDGLKGFAILLVILGHVLSGYLDANTFPEAYHGLHSLRNWIYSFHMPLFFLVSGYTFTLAYYRDGKLRRKGYFRQLGSLVWIYVLFALILWCVKQAVPELVNDTYTIEDLYSMFTVPLGNFWYLYVLVVFYGIAALIRLPRWPGRWLLFLGGVSIVAAALHLDWYVLTQYRILYHLSFFFVGCLLCRNRRLLGSGKLLGVSVMFLSTAAFFYYFLYCRDWYANWKYAIAMGTCYVYLYQFYHWKKLSGSPFLQLMGKYCLELYLLHTFFTAGFRTLLPMVGIVSPWLSVWINFLLSTALSLGLALLSRRVWVLDIVFRPARFVTELKDHRNR
jgi:fucose 4-O-acetylase-like acetyltransferase